MCGFNQAHAWILGLRLQEACALKYVWYFYQHCSHDGFQQTIFYQLPNSLHFATDEYILQFVTVWKWFWVSKSLRDEQNLFLSI